MTDEGAGPDQGFAWPDPPAEPRPEPPAPPPAPSGHARDAALRRRLLNLELMLGRHEDASGAVSYHPPAWLRKTQGENRWPVGIALLVVIVLQITVRGDLQFQPRYLLPALEALLFAVLTIVNPTRIDRESTLLRTVGLMLVVAASLATAWSAARLVYQLATGHGGEAIPLLINGGSIWLTNVIVFSLWYWEFDRGGPAARANARVSYPDFLFAQMTVPELAGHDWEPNYIDYLYLSFTNAMAFSPTDTLPLSRWAKLTMMFQSTVSLVTVALVVARAVNIFK